MNRDKMKYNLTFISDEDLLVHVKQAIKGYSFVINLKSFNKNIIDPIKLTFDKLIYKKTIVELIDSEVIRQIDKSNNNIIGYFHQNIFKYIGGIDWIVPEFGFDIINESKQIFVEMKNKHNTMNSSSSQKTYMKMQDQLIDNPDSTCMLVEVIATKSQNIEWKISLDGKQKSRDKIRRVSIDKFYEIVTGDQNAFRDLCQVLPLVITDAIKSLNEYLIKNTVLDELQVISDDVLASLYLLAFETYDGFQDFLLKNSV